MISVTPSIKVTESMKYLVEELCDNGDYLLLTMANILVWVWRFLKYRYISTGNKFSFCW